MFVLGYINAALSAWGVADGDYGFATFCGLTAISAFIQASVKEDKQ